MFIQSFTITKLLLFLSFICFLIGTFTLYISWQSLKWPSVTGEISFTSKRTKGTINSHKSALMTLEVTEILYDYTVVDQGGFWGRIPASKSTKYKPKDKVTVYYNPSNPSQSTLHPGPNWVYFVSFLSVSIMLAFTAYAWNNKTKALTRHSSGTAELPPI